MFKLRLITFGALKEIADKRYERMTSVRNVIGSSETYTFDDGSILLVSACNDGVIVQAKCDK